MAYLQSLEHLTHWLVGIYKRKPLCKSTVSLSEAKMYPTTLNSNTTQLSQPTGPSEWNLMPSFCALQFPTRNMSRALILCLLQMANRIAKAWPAFNRFSNLAPFVGHRKVNRGEQIHIGNIILIQAGNRPRKLFMEEKIHARLSIAYIILFKVVFH